MDGFEYSPSPPQAVLDYLKLKGLKPAFSWQDVMREEHSFGFTVAKATQLNVLTTIQDSLVKAEADGIPFAQWAKDLEPQLKTLGWWGEGEVVDQLTGEIRPAQLGSPRRLKTIHWANTRTARAAGQWERIQRTKAALPFLIYQLGPSENHRPHHEDKEGLILRVDDTFWEVWLPPNGWGCKCHVRQISAAEAQRRGFIDAAAPVVPEEDFVNKRTGEVSTVPQGIDPGWNTNPGFNRAMNVRRFLADDFNAAPLNLARIAIADYTRDSEFKAMMLGERPDQFAIPIARLPADVVRVIDVPTQTVLVTSQTLSRHNSNFNPAKYPPPEEWAVIMERLADGTAEIFIEDSGRALNLYVKHSGVINPSSGEFKAVIKKTANGELLLTSFRGHKNMAQKYGRRLK